MLLCMYIVESMEQLEKGSVVNFDPNVPRKSSKLSACTSDCMAQPAAISWSSDTSTTLYGRVVHERWCSRPREIVKNSWRRSRPEGMWLLHILTLVVASRFSTNYLVCSTWHVNKFFNWIELVTQKSASQASIQVKCTMVVHKRKRPCASSESQWLIQCISSKLNGCYSIFWDHYIFVNWKM